MRSYPTKSPAATCTLDAGFQIEWHPRTSLTGEDGDDDDAGSTCSSCSCGVSACGSHHGSTYSLAAASLHPTPGVEDEQNTLLASDDRPVIVVVSATPSHPNSTVDPPSLSGNNPPTALLPKLCPCCHTCHRTKWLMAAFGLMLCELIPWIVGFTLIIYFYRMLGIGPGMGILLIMVVIHSLLRFLRAHGDLDCFENKLKKKQTLRATISQIQSQGASENLSVTVVAEERGNPEQIVNSGVISEVIGHPQEQPPSYEVALTKPPPYDLNLHLTPNNTDHFKVFYMKNSKESDHNEICGSSNPSSQITMTAGYSQHDDLFLPSYQDVMENSLARKTDHTEITQNILVTDL